MNNKQKMFIQHFIVLFVSVVLTSCYTMAPQTNHSSTHHSGNTLAGKNINALNDAIARYQSSTSHAWSPIQSNIILRKGDDDDNVVLLRERLQASGDLPMTETNSSTFYDNSVVLAVKSFQKHHGLKPDGMVGGATLEELNVPPNERIKQLQDNIARWNQLERQLGDRYLLVNIPNYRLYLFDHNQQVLSMAVIVGRPERPTPELSSEINRLILNPYWHVPTKLAKKDILPKIQEDPNYLNDMNIKVFRQESNDKEPVDNEKVDWDAINEDDLNYDFRQDPGEKNSLGVVKFEFPNRYDVYLHDTPAKELFSKDPRDFSSGCIRLENPFALVDYLIQNDPDWNNDKIQATLASKKPTYVTLTDPLPITIAYITAWVDDQGKINYRKDIYHLDSH